MFKRSILCVIFITLCCSCQKNTKAELTILDLLKAQGIVAFLVEMPADLHEKDYVSLELFGADGVVDSSDFAQGMSPKEILRVFVHKNNDDYTFSVVGDSFSVNDMKLNYGDTQLRAWRGDSYSQVFQAGDPLAGFTNNGGISYMEPSGDTLLLRVTIKKGSEQTASSNH
jgi:hypothetical protein